MKKIDGLMKVVAPDVPWIFGLWILASTLLTPVALEAAALDRFDEIEYQVVEVERFDLFKHPTEMSMRFAEPAGGDAEAAERLKSKGENLEFQRLLPEKSLFFDASKEVANGATPSSILASLNSDESVRFAYPVYFNGTNGKRIFLNDEVVVRLSDGQTTDDLLKRVGFGLEVIETLSSSENIHVVRLLQPKELNPFKACEAMRQMPEVMWAEPNFCAEATLSATTPNDNYFAHQWHHRNTATSPQNPARVDADVDSDDAWDSGFGSVGIRLGNPMRALR